MATGKESNIMGPVANVQPNCRLGRRHLRAGGDGVVPYAGAHPHSRQVARSHREDELGPVLVRAVRAYW